VGAYGSDLLFQVFGFAAFFAAGGYPYSWLEMVSQPGDQFATGDHFWLHAAAAFAPFLLSLWHFPRCAAAARGMLGSLVSGSLQAGFNFWGASLIAFAFFLTSLFMTRAFLLRDARLGEKGPLARWKKLGLLQKAQARWQNWRDGREQQRMRRRLEETRISGRKPVNKLGANAASSEPQASIQLADESDIFETEEKKKNRAIRASLRFFSCMTRRRKRPAPKIG